MITRYTLVLSYHDRSGIIAAFGPYKLPEHAERARQELAKLPLEDGVWETVETHDWPAIPDVYRPQGRYRVGGGTDDYLSYWYVWDSADPTHAPLPGKYDSPEKADAEAGRLNTALES